MGALDALQISSKKNGMESPRMTRRKERRLKRLENRRNAATGAAATNNNNNHNNNANAAKHKQDAAERRRLRIEKRNSKTSATNTTTTSTDSIPNHNKEEAVKPQPNMPMPDEIPKCPKSPAVTTTTTTTLTDAMKQNKEEKGTTEPNKRQLKRLKSVRTLKREFESNGSPKSKPSPSRKELLKERQSSAQKILMKSKSSSCLESEDPKPKASSKVGAKRNSDFATVSSGDGAGLLRGILQRQNSSDSLRLFDDDNDQSDHQKDLGRKMLVPSKASSLSVSCHSPLRAPAGPKNRGNPASSKLPPDDTEDDADMVPGRKMLVPSKASGLKLPPDANEDKADMVPGRRMLVPSKASGRSVSCRNLALNPSSEVLPNNSQPSDTKKGRRRFLKKSKSSASLGCCDSKHFRVKKAGKRHSNFATVSFDGVGLLRGVLQRQNSSDSLKLIDDDDDHVVGKSPAKQIKSDGLSRSCHGALPSIPSHTPPKAPTSRRKSDSLSLSSHGTVSAPTPSSTIQSSDGKKGRRGLLKKSKSVACLDSSNPKPVKSKKKGKRHSDFTPISFNDNGETGLFRGILQRQNSSDSLKLIDDDDDKDNVMKTPIRRKSKGLSVTCHGPSPPSSTRSVPKHPNSKIVALRAKKRNLETRHSQRALDTSTTCTNTQPTDAPKPRPALLRSKSLSAMDLDEWRKSLQPKKEEPKEKVETLESKVEAATIATPTMEGQSAPTRTEEGEEDDDEKSSVGVPSKKPDTTRKSGFDMREQWKKSKRDSKKKLAEEKAEHAKVESVKTVPFRRQRNVNLLQRSESLRKFLDIDLPKKKEEPEIFHPKASDLYFNKDKKTRQCKRRALSQSSISIPTMFTAYMDFP